MAKIIRHYPFLQLKSSILILFILFCSCADLIVKDTHYEQFTTPHLLMKSTVKNRGIKASPPSNTSLSVRYNWSDPWTIKSRIATPPLSSGQEIELPMWLFSSNDLAQPGKCLHVRVCADADNDVQEISNSNNCLEKSFLNNRYCSSCDLCCQETLPGSFDWRNWDGSNWVTGVKNQAQCGSCWAFSAVASVESSRNVSRNASEISNLNLSEQNLVSCGGAGDCQGGWVHLAFQYVLNTGIVNESTFSYQSINCIDSDNNCRSACNCTGSECALPCNCTFGSYNQRWRINAYHHVTISSSANQISEIKRALLCHGPLSACGTWSIDTDGTRHGHCVQIVGWDDNIFPTIIQDAMGWSRGGWLFKNSWGTSWGNGGYGVVPFSGHTFSDIANRSYYPEGVNP